MINKRQAKKYCKEDISKIENYDKAVADTSQTWDLHHRTEIWWNCTAKDLIENECYYHRKACELIFLTKAEHASLHTKGKKRRPFSEETKRKMSVAKKGKKFTGEHRKRIADAAKKRWENKKEARLCQH